MIALLSKLFGLARAAPASPTYEYPNETDSTMDDAVASMWRCYNDLGRQVQISVQGMGGTVEQYQVHDAEFRDGVLSWEDLDRPDRLEIRSEAEFLQHFLPWALKRATPFSDTNELCFAVEGLETAKDVST